MSSTPQEGPWSVMLRGSGRRERPRGAAPGPHGSGRGGPIRRFAVRGASPPCGPQSDPKRSFPAYDGTLPRGRSEALSAARWTA
jgi:hypothetical protein